MKETQTTTKKRKSKKARFIPVTDFFKSRFSKYPRGKIKFHDGLESSSTMSYHNFDLKSDYLANVLTELYCVSARKETMVGICMERSIELLIAIFAIWKAGGTLVPLNFEHADLLRYKLEQTKLRIVIGQESTRDLLPHAIQFLDCYKPLPSPYQHSRPRNTDIKPHTRAYIMYTSGSTGNPKGVVIEHKSLPYLLRTAKRRLYENILPPSIREQIIAKDAGLILSPVNFDAFLQELFQALLTPSTHIISETFHFSPVIVGNIIKREKITFVTILATLLSDINPEHLCKVRDLISMGVSPKEGILYELARKNPKTTFHNAYGVTECTVQNTLNPNQFKTWDPEKIKSIGIASMGSTLHLVDPETLQPVNNGETGELLISGPILARGYFKNPTLTQERFIKIRLPIKKGEQVQTHLIRAYRTGDLGVQNPDGTITLRGRLNRVVKVQGVQVNLEEIEKTLESHPNVTRAAVVAKKNDDTSFYLIAYVQQKQDLSDTTSELLKTLSKLYPYTLPRQIMNCLIPLNDRNKIDYSQLPEPTQIQIQHFLSPSSNSEKSVTQIWCEIIFGHSKGEVSINRTFAEYGASSLDFCRLETRLIALLKDKVKKLPQQAQCQEPNPKAITTSLLKKNYKTIQEQAAYIDELLAKLENVDKDTPQEIDLGETHRLAIPRYRTFFKSNLTLQRPWYEDIDFSASSSPDSSGAENSAKP